MEAITKIRQFTPIESQNPVYLKAADEDLFAKVMEEHDDRTFAEVKEDGYRMQVHKKGEEVRAYTRSMKPILLNLFPELNGSLQRLPDCILDTELIGTDRIGLEGFNSVKKRFRHRISEQGIEKYLQSSLLTEHPMSLVVFDTLMWEGQAQLCKPLDARRKITEQIQEKNIIPSTKRLITDARELADWFGRLTDGFYEGLVCKNPSSPYVPGSRTLDWIKLKRSETLDLSVLGVYFNDQSEISQLLVGTYNDKTRRYETLGKVNAKREGMNADLDFMLEPVWTDIKPKNVDFTGGKEELVPDMYVHPDETIVVEVAAMNLQRGKNSYACGLGDDSKAYSLRIGWLKRIRDDKNPYDGTTTEQVAKMFEAQRGE